MKQQAEFWKPAHLTLVTHYAIFVNTHYTQVLFLTRKKSPVCHHCIKKETIYMTDSCFYSNCFFKTLV